MDFVSDSVSVPALQTVLRAAASALSAHETSEKKSGIWLDSKPPPAAPPGPSLLAVEGAVSSQVLGTSWRWRWLQERGH